MPIHKVPSCNSDYDPDALSAQAAMDMLLTRSRAVTETETIPLRDALHRVLAESIVSPINVPGHTNSAMDGYAINGNDIPSQNAERDTVALRLVGKALAGHPYAGEVRARECVRIMTGAAMPRGCDTVVMQEHVEARGDEIIIDFENTAGQNVRAAGEDIAKGAGVLNEGHCLTAADIGLLASVGLTRVRVWRKPRVAFFSTGSEIISAGEALLDHQLYDSNRHTLDAMLSRCAVDYFDYGIVSDTRDAIRDALQRATPSCDLIISTGSASVGETDFVADLIDELGELHFRKVAIKPGRPLTFATLGVNAERRRSADAEPNQSTDDKPNRRADAEPSRTDGETSQSEAAYLALPGNPVSTMVMFYYFVQPVIARISGGAYTRPPRFTAVCESPLKKRPGRLELQRGILFSRDDGVCAVQKTGAQGSGILNSMSQANCLIVLDEDCTAVSVGAEVQVIPFHGLT